MKNLKIILIIIAGFLIKSCILPVEPKEKSPDLNFKIINSSSVEIYYTVSINLNEILYRKPEESDKILIGSFKADATFEDFFKDGRLLTIFIYKKSTLDNNTWQAIKDQGLYDKRYDLTLEQLKALNYEIVYTGL